MVQTDQKNKHAGVLAFAAILCCALLTGCGRSHGKALAASAAGEKYVGPAPSISEVMPANGSTLRAHDGKYYPWAEIVNNNGVPVQLGEHCISNNWEDYTKWQFPAIVLQPGERQVVFFSGLEGQNGELHAPFTLEEKDAALFLADQNGDMLERFSWQKALVPNLAAIRLADSVIGFTAFATPGAENDTRCLPTAPPQLMDDSDLVVLNELQLKNRREPKDMDGDYPAWLELYNRSSSSVSLLGYGLSTQLENPAQWLFPDISIGPNEYLIVFLSEKDRYAPELHASFSVASDTGCVFLRDTINNRVDFIPIHPDMPAEVSVGRAGDTMRYLTSSTPGAENEELGFEIYRGFVLSDAP